MKSIPRSNFLRFPCDFASSLPKACRGPGESELQEPTPSSRRPYGKQTAPGEGRRLQDITTQSKKVRNKQTKETVCDEA